MTKQGKREISFRCPQCNGSGIIAVDKIDKSQPSRPHLVRCPRCAGSVTVNFPSGEEVEISVNGAISDEVERVLTSAYTRIAQLHSKKNVEKGGSMKADVAVLTALPMELEAFLRHGTSWERIETEKGSIRTYYQRTTETGVSVVAACASGMGQLNAALLTRDIIDVWSPKKLILVGIAGGLRREISLGDIVVSDQIVDYELGKVTSFGANPRWSVYRSDALLRDRIENYRSLEWLSRVSTARPDGKQNIIPKIHSGVVLSGNKVIADEKTAGALRSVWTRAAAIEMEASGIAAALYQTSDSPSFVMIKGICDRADSKKDDRWQAYAADVAGAFTMAFILDKLHPSDTKAPKPEKVPVTSVPSLPSVDFRAIRLALSSAFDLRELKILSSDLGVDWDNIAGGDVKDEKIVELLWYMKRRNNLNKLIDAVKQERPGLLDAYVP